MDGRMDEKEEEERVKLASSNESEGPAHSHPPSRNIRSNVGTREER